MEIISYIWIHYLHIPLFNLLIWIYNNYTNYNMTVAIIILTVMLRIVLLPLAILEERRKSKKKKIDQDIKQIGVEYSTDPIKRRDAIRAYLRKNSIRPWAKALSLVFQGIVLYVLYKVFVDGVDSDDSMHQLYPTVQRPDFINTMFLGIDVSHPSLYFAAAVAAYLFAESLVHLLGRRRRGEIRKNEQLFIMLFPAFSYLILAFLPATKSIFILTSLAFSTIISMITSVATINSKARAPKKA